MKKQFLLILFICFSFASRAQFGVNTGLVKPSSDFGYIFKPAASFGAVYYLSTFDERFQSSIGFSFSSFSPRQDTFFNYGVQSGGSGTFYLPAYDVWHSYYMLSGRVHGDFLILDKDFTPTIGYGLFVNNSMYNHDGVLQTVISSSEIGSDVFLGYMLRAGLLYRINDAFQFKINAGRVRAKSFTTGVKSPYYLFEFEFAIDFQEL